MSDLRDDGDASQQGRDFDAPVTGHPTIDEALQRLERVRDLDISLHPEEFDAMHGVLRESLANAGRDGAATESP